jgi:hypothetical protein
MDNEYKEFATSSTIFEIDLLIKNLQANGIDAKSIDQILDEHAGKPALYVKTGMEEKAYEVLRDLNLLDFFELKDNGK